MNILIDIFNKFVIGLVITVVTVVFTMFCLAGIVHRKSNLFSENQLFFQGIMKRRREIIRRQNARLGSEAQGILIVQAQSNQINKKSAVKALRFFILFSKIFFIGCSYSGAVSEILPQKAF